MNLGWRAGHGAKTNSLEVSEYPYEGAESGRTLIYLLRRCRQGFVDYFCQKLSKYFDGIPRNLVEGRVFTKDPWNTFFKTLFYFYKTFGVGTKNGVIEPSSPLLDDMLFIPAQDIKSNYSSYWHLTQQNGESTKTIFQKFLIIQLVNNVINHQLTRKVNPSL